MPAPDASPGGSTLTPQLQDLKCVCLRGARRRNAAMRKYKTCYPVLSPTHRPGERANQEEWILFHHRSLKLDVQRGNLGLSLERGCAGW